MRIQPPTITPCIPWRRVLSLGELPAAWKGVMSAGDAWNAIELEEVADVQAAIRIITRQTPHLMLMKMEPRNDLRRQQLETVRRFLPYLPVAVLMQKDAPIPLRADYRLPIKPDLKSQQAFLGWIKEGLPRNYRNDQRRVLQHIKEVKKLIWEEKRASRHIAHPELLTYSQELTRTFDKLKAIEESLYLLRKEELYRSESL